jgi:hypothetical protein
VKDNKADSDNNGKHHSDGKIIRCFTVEEAESLIPFVRHRLIYLQNAAGQLLERRRHLDYLLHNGSSRESNSAAKPYREELLASFKHLEQLWQRLQEELAVLRNMGLLIRSVAQGIVDFPFWHQGNVALLCWQIHEPRILHWHPLEGCFGSRLPLNGSSSSPWALSSNRSVAVRT